MLTRPLDSRRRPLHPTFRFGERFMDRYRGTSGPFGWMVTRADRRWLKRIYLTAKRLSLVGRI